MIKLVVFLCLSLALFEIVSPVHSFAFCRKQADDTDPPPLSLPEEIKEWKKVTSPKEQTSAVYFYLDDSTIISKIEVMTSKYFSKIKFEFFDIEVGYAFHISYRQNSLTNPVQGYYPMNINSEGPFVYVEAVFQKQNPNWKQRIASFLRGPLEKILILPQELYDELLAAGTR